jgi:phospho-N-acetylmuramoyl-pentapeptide-transferase
VIRLLIAAGVSLAFSLIGTQALIKWLTRHRIGQPIREDGPQGHITKAGTPTMGGVAIVGGAFIGWVASDVYNGVYTRTGIIVMLTIVGGSLVGLVDDWIKVVRERNLGLNKRAKIVGLLTVAFGFAIVSLSVVRVDTHLSFAHSTSFDLTEVGWALWAVLLIIGFANAVNLTDGLDGLAAGSGIFAFAAFMMIAFWQFRHPDVYHNDHALDLAVIAASMIGGLVGFLWWNAAPAQIFMGDAGSLAIGVGLAALALTTNTQLLLPIIGGLFVIETLSVILQVARFRTTGKRFFRMAPLHHHFELGGWPETTVIVRLWILSGLCTAFGVGIFYADSIAKGITK